MPAGSDPTPGSVLLGQNIRRILAEKGISQGELADSVGVSRDTVVRYLRGEIDMPVSRLRAIGEVLDTRPCIILNGDEAA